MNSSFRPIITTFCICLISFTITAQKKERKYELSPEKSKISWVGNNQTDKFSGEFKIKNGQITLVDDDLTHAVVFVDSRSFICKNCGDEEKSRKITEFVKSADFLNTENMDYAVFKMYKSEPLKDSKDGNYRVEGNLTIIGYSNTINLPVIINEKKGKLFLEGKLTINRSLWQLNDPKDSESKVLLGQTIELYLNLESK